MRLIRPYLVYFSYSKSTMSKCTWAIKAFNEGYQPNKGWTCGDDHGWVLLLSVAFHNGSSQAIRGWISGGNNLRTPDFTPAVFIFTWEGIQILRFTKISCQFRTFWRHERKSCQLLANVSSVNKLTHPNNCSTQLYIYVRHAFRAQSRARAPKPESWYM